MTDHARVVVIGGGITGVSVAYHLADAAVIRSMSYSPLALLAEGHALPARAEQTRD